MVVGNEDPREVALLVGPGVLGVGAGTLVGLLLFESLLPVALVAGIAAIAGHVAGLYLVQRSRDA